MHATTLNGMLRCIALLVTLPSLLAAPIPAKNIDESLRASVVRIEVAAAPPNYLQPWQVGQQEHRRGSGFQIAGRRILTNHHVIEDAVDIRVSRGGEAKRWHARVVTFAPDVDLAVIEIVDAAAFFANGAAPAVLSSSLLIKASSFLPLFPSSLADRRLPASPRSHLRDSRQTALQCMFTSFHRIPSLTRKMHVPIE